MQIIQFENGYWYVVDDQAHATVAIRLTEEDAVAKCKAEGWEVEKILPLAA